MLTTNLWIAIAALLTIALVVLWGPYFRNSKIKANEINSRSNANTQSYQHSLLKLEQQLNDNRINAAEFETLKTELSRKLIQDEAHQEQQLVVGKRTIVWPIIASVFTITLSISLYLKLGAVDQLDTPAQVSADNPHSGLSREQQLALALQEMELQVSQNPKNSQYLFQLAHAYIAAAEFDKAVDSFNQLIELEGEHAEFIGPQAQALYYKNSQKINPEIEALIARALALDPQDTSTLVLLGMDNFVHSKYADAITDWQKALNTKRPGVDVVAIEGAINEAKKRLSLTGEKLPEPPKARPSASVQIQVSISKELTGQYNQDQTVFIYAIPVKGARMPLAAIKLTVADLPKLVTLDDSLAMTPMAKISNHKQVQLFAIISKSGSAGIKTGDLQGLVKDAAVDNEQPYTLVIDKIIE